jgi:hypothetical protein
VSDIYDVVVDLTRELHEARRQLLVYRGWLCASLDRLHEQHQKIGRQRRQLTALREENRQLAGRVDTSEAA